MAWSCHSFPIDRLCKEACAFLCTLRLIETWCFHALRVAYIKQNNMKRSAGDDEHETAKKVIKKGIFRKWIVLVGGTNIPDWLK